MLLPPRRGFSATDRDLARSLAAQGQIALENALLHSVVRRQAVTDELTDLANRRRFMEALQQDVARSDRLDTPLALVLFDLDHFKQINDQYGHQIGDDVLRSAAEVIRTRVRETDLAARIGGEEFAVILPGTDLSGAAALAEHLRRDLADHVEVTDLRTTVTGVLRNTASAAVTVDPFPVDITFTNSPGTTSSEMRSPFLTSASGPPAAASGVMCRTMVPKAVPLMRASEIRTMSFTPCCASLRGIGK